VETLEVLSRTLPGIAFGLHEMEVFAFGTAFHPQLAGELNYGIAEVSTQLKQEVALAYIPATPNAICP
jgi:hypothetical protein